MATFNITTASATEARSELARRIRSFRAVSLRNDPKRGYRRNMNDCRLGRASYHRLCGIPKVAKEDSQRGLF